MDARPDELVVLRRKGGDIVREEAIPDYTGYSAEDMLVDERLFDTEIYAPEMREKVDRYRPDRPSFSVASVAVEKDHRLGFRGCASR